LGITPKIPPNQIVHPMPQIYHTIELKLLLGLIVLGKRCRLIGWGAQGGLGSEVVCTAHHKIYYQKF